MGLRHPRDRDRNDLVLPPTPDDDGTDIAGQTLIVLDPDRRSDGGFAARIRDLIDALRESGMQRMPADRRYRARDAAAERGIPVTPAIAALLASNP